MDRGVRTVLGALGPWCLIQGRRSWGGGGGALGPWCLKPIAHWRTGRDKTGQDRPVWQCAGLQDGLSLVFRTVLSMLNV